MGEPSQPPALQRRRQHRYSLVLPGTPSLDPAPQHRTAGGGRRPGRRLSGGPAGHRRADPGFWAHLSLTSAGWGTAALGGPAVEVGTATPSPVKPTAQVAPGHRPSGCGCGCGCAQTDPYPCPFGTKGAQVIHADTAGSWAQRPGKWTLAISQKGELKLILRKAGYQDRLISISQAEDSDINEMLVAVETKKRPRVRLALRDERIK